MKKRYKALSDVEEYDRRISGMTHGQKKLSPLEQAALNLVEDDFFKRNGCGYFPGAAMGINMIRRTGRKMPYKTMSPKA